MCARVTYVLGRSRRIGQKLHFADEDTLTAESARLPHGRAGGIGILGRCLHALWNLGAARWCGCIPSPIDDYHASADVPVVSEATGSLAIGKKWAGRPKTVYKTLRERKMA